MHIHTHTYVSVRKRKIIYRNITIKYWRVLGLNKHHNFWLRGFLVWPRTSQLPYPTCIYHIRFWNLLELLGDTTCRLNNVCLEMGRKMRKMKQGGKGGGGRRGEGKGCRDFHRKLSLHLILFNTPNPNIFYKAGNY